MFHGRDHAEAPPEGRGFELIDATDAPRQVRWLVRCRSGRLRVVRSLPGVESVEVESPSSRGNLRRLHARPAARGAPAAPRCARRLIVLYFRPVAGIIAFP